MVGYNKKYLQTSTQRCYEEVVNFFQRKSKIRGETLKDQKQAEKEEEVGRNVDAFSEENKKKKRRN